MESPAVGPFLAASKFFADAVAAVPVERYEEQWSPEWRVLDLIAHGNRANVLVVEYYEHPVPIAGPEYLLPENIAARGRQAVVALGGDPVGAVRSATAKAAALVADAPDDATIGTPFGARSLGDYLPSRTAELVIHGLDLQTGVEPPADALAECGTFLVTRAVATGRGVDVVRALSGRATLPAGFSVV